MGDAVEDQFADDRVAFPERDTFGNQVISSVCGIGEAFRGSHGGDFRFYGHGIEHIRENADAGGERVVRVEYRRFVFLHIFVVCQRQAFHDGEQRHHVAVNPAGFSTDELCHIRVLFLWHDAGTGTVGVINLNETELRAAPEDQFFTEAGEVHGADRRVAEEFQRVVTVADSVHGIGAGTVKSEGFRKEGAVGMVSGSGHGTGTQWIFIHTDQAVAETAVIPFEHFKVRHHMEGERNRLCPLEMGVTWHDRVLMGFRDGVDGMKQPLQVFHGVLYGLPGPHAEIDGNLIVTASGSMKAFARCADPFSQDAFDIHMDVFVIDREFDFSVFDILQDAGQSCVNCVSVFL